MKVLTLLLVTLVCFSEISAVSLRKSSEASTAKTLNQLRQLAQNGPFAKRMISTIEMSLTTGDKVDEVIGYVETALGDQRLKHGEIQKERDATLAEIGGRISAVNDELSEDRNHLDKVNAEIKALRTEVETNENKRDSLTTEIENLGIRKVAIENARSNDLENFNRRQNRDANAIAALNKIIPQLEELNETGTFIQKDSKEFQTVLAELPRGNPIQALVQISAGLNPGKLNFVISKLTDILEGIIASKADDENKEKDAENKFNLLIKEIDGLVTSKSAQKVATIKALTKAQTSLDKKETEQDEVKEEIENNVVLLASEQALFDQQTEQYRTKLNNSQDAIDALETALRILKDGQGTLDSSESVAEQNA